MSRSRWCGVVAGVLCVVLGSGCGGGGAPKVAASVDGTPISSRKMRELATLMAKGDAIRPEIEQGELHQKVVDQVVLAYLIRLTYLENVAAKMGVSDNADHREEEAIAQLPEQAFSARGWGAGDLKAALRATRLSMAIANKIFPSPGVSEEDLRKYYDEHAEQFRNYWHAEARIAFFKAEEPARSLRQKVEGGQPFSDAAHTLGAEQEGSLGEVTPDAPLGQPILKAIGTLAAGQVSDPIAAGGGWFVATVARRVETPARTFDKVKEELTKLQADDRRQTLFYEWLGKQLAKAKVEVSAHYGRWNPQTLEVG